MRIYYFEFGLDFKPDPTWFMAFPMFSLSLKKNYVSCFQGKKSALSHEQLISNGAIEKELPSYIRLKLIRFIFSKMRIH